MTLQEYKDFLEKIINSKPGTGDREVYIQTPNECDDGELTAIPLKKWQFGQNGEIYLWLGPA
jgi:hypothetical protein